MSSSFRAILAISSAFSSLTTLWLELLLGCIVMFLAYSYSICFNFFCNFFNSFSVHKTFKKSYILLFISESLDVYDWLVYSEEFLDSSSASFNSFFLPFRCLFSINGNYSWVFRLYIKYITCIGLLFLLMLLDNWSIHYLIATFLLFALLRWFVSTNVFLYSNQSTLSLIILSLTFSVDNVTFLNGA